MRRLDLRLTMTTRLGCIALPGLLLIGCGGEPSEITAPVEAPLPFQAELWSSEAKPIKSVLLDAIRARSLEPSALTDLLAPGFLAEPFDGRPGTARSASGILLSDWAPAAPSLDPAAFTASWNRWLGGFATIDTLEVHTWEVQSSTDDGDRLTTVEALWVVGTEADGRRREDRLDLALDFQRIDGAWRLSSVGARDARTAIGPGPWFVDVTDTALPPGRDQTGVQLYTDGGPALADADGDGDIDLFLPRLHDSARLYLNDGEGSFEDATMRSGLALKVLGKGTNSALFLDYENDGDLDLLVGVKEAGFLLMLRDGDRYRRGNSDLIGGAGQWESIVAADYDGDGLLDVYACNYGLIDSTHQPGSYVNANDGLPNLLLRNASGEPDPAPFVDATEQAGMAVDATRWSYAASWADYDRDGDMDLYVANDYGPNALYRNDGGRFAQVAATSGAEDAGNGMSALWFDHDRDGWLDLYVSNMQSFAGNRLTKLPDFPGTEEDRALYRRFSQGNTLLRNRGDGTFEDVTIASGAKPAFWAWGALATDLDADGDEDLFCSAGMYTGAKAADT